MGNGLSSTLPIIFGGLNTWLKDVPPDHQVRARATELTERRQARHELSAGSTRDLTAHRHSDVDPAVDMASTAAAVRPTDKIRTFDERLDPGGGGINVARVVHALGGDSPALVMTGGVTGHVIEQLLGRAGVRWQARRYAGATAFLSMFMTATVASNIGSSRKVP